MRRFLFLMLAMTVVLGAVVGFSRPTPATADDDNPPFFLARLIGFEETPAISSTGVGSFRAELINGGTTLQFRLSYANLQGGNVAAAHIHLGQRGVAGGVMAFLCGGGGKPACPSSPGTVTGTIIAADVIGPASQGIAAGEFAEVIRALRSGVGYANVHTTQFPGGEIRGQVRFFQD